MRRILSIPLVATVGVAVLTYAPPAAAESDSGYIEDFSVERTSNSVHISWPEIDGAVEYVAVDEVPKPGNRDSRGEPLYRGSEASLEIFQLTESEPLRIRILALDENEMILKRSMVRTTAADDHEYPSLTWITDGENFDFRIDELGSQDVASTSDSMNVTWPRGDIPVGDRWLYRVSHFNGSQRRFH